LACFLAGEIPHMASLRYYILAAALALLAGGTLCGCAARSGSPGDPSRGLYHKVRLGDSLARIAQRYGTTKETIARANNLPNPARLYSGMPLWIPPRDAGGGPNLSPSSGPRTLSARNAKIANLRDGPAKTAVSNSAGVGAPKAPYVGPIPSLAQAGATSPVYRVGRATDADRLGFEWPVSPEPEKSSVFWASQGLDLKAPQGTPVRAARDGVILVSGAPLRGYGNTVFIDHGDGFVSVYAHNVRNLVRQGQKVKRGQIIAQIGSTDAETSKLHFEIRKGVKAEMVNPLRYLPAL
jgi:lipoprotein NlpD